MDGGVARQELLDQRRAGARKPQNEDRQRGSMSLVRSIAQKPRSENLPDRLTAPLPCHLVIFDRGATDAICIAQMGKGIVVSAGIGMGPI